jgi:type IV fimbrial biogenesis protein FimT
VERRSCGFTLTELLITVIVLGVLVAMGVPSFNNFLLDSRRTGTLNEFVAALNLARSEAIKRGVPVAVCKTVNGLDCSGAGTTWAGGWLVFVNLDNDSPAVVDAGETVLRSRQVANPAYTFAPVADFANSVTYRPDGSITPPNIAFTNGRFTYCDKRGLRSARAVIINITGRPRLSRDTNGDGIDEDESGANLACS